METYVSLVQSSSGRDKILRASGYGAVLLSGIFRANLSTRLLTLAKQISSARVILRLLEDIPALKNTLKWGREESDITSRLCTIVSSISMQLFYIFEHVAWAGDVGVVGVKSTKAWWTSSTFCWVVSLLSSLVKCVRKIQILKHKKSLLQRQHEIHLLADQSLDGKDGLIVCEEELKVEVLNLVKNFLDFVIAVSMLPWKGFLWAGKSSVKKNAVIGLISSIVSILIMLRGMKKEIKRN